MHGGTLGTLMRELTFVEAGRVEWQEAPDAVLPGPAGAIVACRLRSPGVTSARHVGTTNGAELATYIVEKGKPLVTVVK